MSEKVELLAPAGSMEALKAAIAAGADAIYMGGSRFGARAFADNFDEEELIKAIDYAHFHNRKIYLTVNTLLKDSEIKELYDFILPYYLCKLDGVIVQDLGVVRYLRRMFPDMEVHSSTQMTLTGSHGAKMMKDLGLTRIVPARELSLEEIQKIKKETGIEIECFIHGALCYCYSGQCLLSSVIGGRSGNRGQCAQPCRLPYKLNEKTEDYLSLKDLCTIDLIPEMIKSGIDSFKIEGRMKHPAYVYTVVSIYRKYIDLYYKNPKSYKVSDEDRKILNTAFQRRGYTDGYYKRHNGKEMISFKRPDIKEQIVAAESYELQRPVSGTLYIRLGEPLLLSVYDDINYITVEGPVPSIAEKHPLTADRIEKQMRKTGNTSFVFDEFSVDMTQDVFLPMQVLNELRREGLEQFYKTIIHSQRRIILTEKQNPVKASKKEQEGFILSALVRSLNQLKVVIQSGKIIKIYVDSSIALEQNVLSFIKEHPEIRFIYASPYIYRRKDEKGFLCNYDRILENYDGILIRSLELLGFLKEKKYSKEMISDYNQYVYNNEAVQMMHEMGISFYTASVELNERELKTMNLYNFAYIAYGYQPVMITANCLVKTSQTCKHKPSYFKMTDRYKNDFLVFNNCRECYNIIYNTSPLYLADMKDRLISLGASEYRLDFVCESNEEVSQIISDYHTSLFTPKEVECSMNNLTRGHLKRGVK